MRKIIFLMIFLFASKSFGQDYTITLSYEASASDCHAAHFDWNLLGIDSFSAGGNSMNVSGTRTYTASGGTFTLSSNSSCIALGASTNNCNIPANLNSRTETSINLIRGIFINLGGCNGGVSIDEFKPNVSITNNKTSSICSGDELDLAATAGFPNVAYHWQYSTDNEATWIDVPLTIGITNTNNTPQTHFSINDLLGTNYEDYFNKKIYFRLGYGQDRPFSNVIPITFSPCAPIITDVLYYTPICSDNIRKVEVTFNEPLENDEILDRIKMKDVTYGSERNERTNVGYDINTKIYSFVNFDALENGHTYKIVYQMKKGNALLGFLESTKTFLYEEVTPITFQTTPTDILCNGDTTGSITIINPQGGNGSYTYSKDGTNFQDNKTFSSLEAGTYQITVKDIKGCTTTQADSLSAPLKPISIKGKTFPSSGPNIADGSIELNNISGGTPAYKIFLGTTEAPNLSQLIAGSYTIKIVDSNNCSKDTIIEVKQKITCITTKTDVKCNGGTDGIITLKIQGGTKNYNVTWKDSDNKPYTVTSTPITTTDNVIYNYIATGFKMGAYTYSISDNDTPVATYNGSAITIKQPTSSLEITSTITQPSPTILTDGQIQINPSGGVLQGGSDIYSYLLSKTDEPKFDNIARTNPITALSNGTYLITVTSSSGCPITSDPITLQALNVKIKITKPIKCIGDSGTLEAVAEGGTRNYNYSWYKDGSSTIVGTSKILTGIDVTKGNYKVEVFDGDYTINDTKDLLKSTNPAIVINPFTITPVKCSNGIDGAIEITVSGGTPGYTYKWSNSDTTKDLSGLIAGTYSVTVTDAIGCTNTSSDIEITQPLAITLPQESISPVLINGQSTGAITFAQDPTGGNGGYTYNWTSSTDTSFTPKTIKNISGLKAGFYTLEIKDSNQCSVSKTFEITESPLLQISIKESSAIKCNGNFNGELQAVVSGGVANYNYQWFKNGLAFGDNSFEQKGLEFGDYKVIVTDFVGATKTATIFTLKQPNLLTVTATSQTNVLCHNASTGTIGITINGGTAPYTQQWTKDGVNYSTNKNLIDLGAGTYQVIVTDAVGHNCTATLLNPIIITQPTAPLAINDLVIKNLTGFETLNGSIKVAITGGTSPYKYSFGSQSNVSIVGSELLLDNLPIGSYTLTITDANGCSTFNNYNLTQPDKLLITDISQTPSSTIKCYGDKFGILEATITGGVLPYTYNWHNVLTPTITASTINPSETLIAGTYELKVTDANGNTFSLKSNPISEPLLLKINSTPKNVSCKNGNDGSITISTSGGTGVPTINWSTGENATTINNLFAGSYSVTITDQNQCQTSETITITEPDILYVSKITKNPPSALGLQDGSIEIQVTGGTPNYNYLWYNGSKDLIYSDLNQPSNTSINNIYAGQYFVTVKDANGCAIIEKDLDKIDPLVLSINQINIVKCNGDATASIKASASGGTPIYYYKWYKTTDPLNAVGLAETLLNVNAGTYYVVLSDSFGLVKQSENITITEPTPLNNTLASQYTRCGDAKDWTITTAPTGGTAPYTYLWNTSQRTANLQDITPSSYSVLVTDNHGCTITKSITITAPPHLATAETITKPTCFEGSDATIVLTSSGGQGPYTYLWNTGEQSNILRNASAKAYTVSITDFKGCVINKAYTIENPPKDVINLGDDVTLCFDQSLTINSTIADDKAKYSWISTKGFTSDKPIITVSEAADYTLVVTNKLGCKATDKLKISKQDTAISAEFAVSSQVFMNEKFIIVDISNPIADSIEWILPPEATVVSKNKDFAELSFSKVGEYELTLNTKKGNCTATQTKKIVVVEGEYINPDNTDLKKKFDLKIYPNPSHGIFTVDVTLDKVMPAHIKVFNLTNNMIIDSKYEEGKDTYKFNFSLNGLTAGVYFVLVESQQGNQLRKIIIE
ncbi:putative secreted protein (Por secretion system target) [Flavobacterium sp. 103]|uniref:T9SS type A sorting domain-containing protein n=1 Tax=Flavobacterium sp. 103 TaxID=2135624 RepID=UPI000D5C972A|nr:T9SS type A sorting domain-containing protein [Flavobacterium sp. 103]PVX44444.1 putative secreted protein (Por secretion system target) [Flavobacterium sp. 103]